MHGALLFCPSHARGLKPCARCSLLVSDLHGMMNEYLEETFFCFLEEGSGELAPGDAAAQVRRVQKGRFPVL